MSKIETGIKLNGELHELVQSLSKADSTNDINYLGNEIVKKRKEIRANEDNRD